MTDKAPIRVLIADDHKQVREGVKALALITDDLMLVGEATNGLEAIHLCNELQLDVVLMDLMMPEMGGISAIAAIRKKHPGLPIIALTTFDDAMTCRLALQAGATHCLGKQVDPFDLLNIIRSVVSDSGSHNL